MYEQCIETIKDIMLEHLQVLEHLQGYHVRAFTSGFCNMTSGFPMMSDLHQRSTLIYIYLH